MKKTAAQHSPPCGRSLWKTESPERLKKHQKLLQCLFIAVPHPDQHSTDSSSHNTQISIAPTAALTIPRSA
ncbi:UNVERIFIED_CONTAM: hypothetical protein FKN15_029276 [Acipenser sinensis]